MAEGDITEFDFAERPLMMRGHARVNEPRTKPIDVTNVLMDSSLTDRVLSTERDCRKGLVTNQQPGEVFRSRESKFKKPYAMR